MTNPLKATTWSSYCVTLFFCCFDLNTFLIHGQIKTLTTRIYTKARPFGYPRALTCPKLSQNVKNSSLCPRTYLKQNIVPLFEDRSDGAIENDPKNTNSTVVRPDSRAVSYCVDGGPCSALAVDRLRDITRCYLQSHGFQGLCPSGAGESGGAGMKVREPATRRADSTSLFLLARNPA